MSPNYIWKCENCDEPLTFNLLNRLILAVLTGLWIAIVLQLKNSIDVNIISGLGLTALLLLGLFIIYYFDFFQKAKKR